MKNNNVLVYLWSEDDLATEVENFSDAKYYLINRLVPSQTRIFTSSFILSVHMLGKKNTEYMIIKVDENGDRLVELPTPFDCNKLCEILEKA